MKEVIDAFVKTADDWDSFHDCVVNANWPTEKRFDQDELEEIFRSLDYGTQMTAIQWGLSDTVFRDQAYVEIQKGLKNK
jgi:hypothetical protein